VRWTTMFSMQLSHAVGARGVVQVSRQNAPAGWRLRAAI
jgi:hypothetical protein